MIPTSDRGEPTLPGDPDVVEELVARLRGYAESAGDAAGALHGVDPAHWSGPAAERFAAAVEHVPAHLRSSRDAFAAAHSALRDYADVLREAHSSANYAAELRTAAAASTAAWHADGAVGPDPGAEDRARADALQQTARERVQIAAATAAARLREVASGAPPPRSAVVPGPTPGLQVEGANIHVASAHPLRDPAGFTGGAGHQTVALRYGAAHHVGFADGTNGSTSWESWTAAGEGRGVGRTTVELLAALGVGVLGVVAARRRRRSGRTAMAAADVDPTALAASRPARTGAIGGVPARLRGGRLHSGAAWRTNLAHTPSASRPLGTARPLVGQAADAPVVVQASSAIRHRGPIAESAT